MTYYKLGDDMSHAQLQSLPILLPLLLFWGLINHSDGPVLLHIMTLRVGALLHRVLASFFSANSVRYDTVDSIPLPILLLRNHYLM